MQQKKKEALKCYLLAYRSVRTPIEYESKLTELEADEEVRKRTEGGSGSFLKASGEAGIFPACGCNAGGIYKGVPQKYRVLILTGL